MRSYERPLVALILALALLLLVAIFQPRLLPIGAPAHSASTGDGQGAASGPVERTRNPGSADNIESGEPGEPPVRSEGFPYDRPQANKDHPSDRLLCSEPERLSTLTDGGMAVAVDPAGHYTLYALPDPETRMPSDDSYELLRGCLPTDIFANTVSFRTDVTGVKTVARPDVAARTRKVQGAGPTRLLTTYTLGSEVSATQALELRDGRLIIRYRLENGSDDPVNVDLRSLLSPTPATPGQDVLFELSGPAEQDAITKDTRLGEDAASRVTRIYAPRPSAASNSSASWRPAPATQPSRIILAAFHRLNSAPFDYDTQERYPMSPNASIAAYWADLALDPGESMTVGQSYGTRTEQGSGD